MYVSLKWLLKWWCSCHYIHTYTHTHTYIYIHVSRTCVCPPNASILNIRVAKRAKRMHFTRRKPSNSMTRPLLRLLPNRVNILFGGRFTGPAVHPGRAITVHGVIQHSVIMIMITIIIVIIIFRVFALFLVPVPAHWIIPAHRITAVVDETGRVRWAGRIGMYTCRRPCRACACGSWHAPGPTYRAVVDAVCGVWCVYMVSVCVPACVCVYVYVYGLGPRIGLSSMLSVVCDVCTWSVYVCMCVCVHV